MSEKTVKLPGYELTQRPPENEETKWWRQWLVEIIFGLWNEKKTVLAEIGFQSRPVSQQEIYREVTRRIYMMKAEKIWTHGSHGHNWVERRVNECATEKYGPKTEDGILKIVNTSAKRGLYEPNPALFKESVDQDTEQLKDELDKPWQEAWKKRVPPETV